jgi:hypothetical protein
MRSGSRSQVESQFDAQDSATRDECEAAGRAQVQDPAVSNRKTTEKGEQHPQSGQDKQLATTFLSLELGPSDVHSITGSLLALAN